MSPWPWCPWWFGSDVETRDGSLQLIGGAVRCDGLASQIEVRAVDERPGVPLLLACATADRAAVQS